MAGQAEKKRAKNAEAYGGYYVWTIILIGIFYFSYRVLWHYTSMGFWQWIGTAWFYVLYYFAYSGIVQGLKTGVSYEYHQDAFIVNAVAQLLATVTDYAYLVYLIVPVYIAVKFGKLLFSWAATPDMSPEQEAAAAKKREKLERKIRQGRVVQVKR